MSKFSGRSRDKGTSAQGMGVRGKAVFAFCAFGIIPMGAVAVAFFASGAPAVVGGVAAGLAVAIVVLAKMWAGKFTDPIGDLVYYASNLSQGNVNQDIGVRSNDEFGELANLFQDISRYISTAATAAEALSRGELGQGMVPTSTDDVLGRSLGHAHDSLAGLIDESRLLIAAAKEGKLQTRGDASKFDGAYKEVVEGFNQTFEAVVHPLSEATQALERMANRDMTAHMDGVYLGDYSKIKDAVNLAATNLGEAIEQVSATAESVVQASREINLGNQSIAQSASDQASALEEVGASLQELATAAQDNSARAAEARELIQETRASAADGVSSMEQLSAAMSRIKESADETAMIIKTIDEIAFQTNLLALNAAVEAARAGDAGKGFAVVADEVRSLAMRSAEAARNTAAMIQESVSKTNEGVALNVTVLKQLRDISTQVDSAGEAVSDISDASKQQSSGVKEISKATEEMSMVTQQNAATTEETASATEELHNQAASMRTVASLFTLRMGGSAAAVMETSDSFESMSIPEEEAMVSDEGFDEFDDFGGMDDLLADDDQGFAGMADF